MGQSYLLEEAITGTLSALVVTTPDTQRVNLEKLPYCNGGSSCQLCDEHDVRYPNLDTMQLLVTTHVTEKQQSRICARNATMCPYESPFNDTEPPQEYFVGGIETYALQLEHSAEAAIFYSETRDSKFAASNHEMEGTLYKRLSNGKSVAIKEFPKTRASQPDVISFEEILEAAGVSSLEESLTESSQRPVRESGVVIYFRVQYFNTQKFFAPSSRFIYNYHLTAQDAGVTIYEPVYERYGDHRTLVIRNGIKLVFIQQGNVGKFDFPTLLLSLVSGLALLAISQTAVDVVALYILPLKSIYRKQKYELSVNFGEVRENKELRELLLNYSEDFEVRRLLSDLQEEKTVDSTEAERVERHQEIVSTLRELLNTRTNNGASRTGNAAARTSGRHRSGTSPEVTNLGSGWQRLSGNA
ncbi:hypothetical protein CYMTET_51503 [Cymbomonas tetramitiformis]|uniref:Uncharacterized protein n=1 Tax=Cymbomonas tetramitiformis TaxID=36881 RepID=A0AAE0BL48_9CHLO|nr:hypothetical protein CYMTET_51503 [Cymbomonas tetramitiformis]